MSGQNKEEAFSDGFDAGQNEALSFMAEKDAEIAHLKAEIERRTTERDYHIRVGDQLAANVRTLAAALKEAQRFMSYFAGETGGSFVGPGTPRSCLEQIIAALHYDGHDTNSLTVGELRRSL